MFYMRTCPSCKADLTRRSQKKFCSNKCQSDFQYNLFLKRWLNNARVITKNISGHIKRYLLTEYGEKCSQCGWKKRNPVTGRVPVEVDHIDGNADNNVPSNLRLICPNCHALTPSFRNLNRGKGRKWRTDRLRRLQKP